jgi:hypothetical protein
MVRAVCVSSWIARVAPVNAFTIPDLVLYAAGTTKRSKGWRVDCDPPPTLTAGLARVCRIGEMSLAQMDLCSQMPNASVFSFLPSAMRVQNNFRHSTISIPSYHRCLYEQERDEQPPFWKADWVLALLPRCPKHLSLLSEHCPRCSLGLLSVRAHPGHGRLVVRCAACFSGLYLPSQDQTVTSPYINLVAAFGKTLIATCRGSDPDIMWLGPVGANTFLMCSGRSNSDATEQQLE